MFGSEEKINSFDNAVEFLLLKPLFTTLPSNYGMFEITEVKKKSRILIIG